MLLAMIAELGRAKRFVAACGQAGVGPGVQSSDGRAVNLCCQTRCASGRWELRLGGSLLRNYRIRLLHSGLIAPRPGERRFRG